jgi:hypothetical protein
MIGRCHTPCGIESQRVRSAARRLLASRLDCQPALPSVWKSAESRHEMVRWRLFGCRSAPVFVRARSTNTHAERIPPGGRRPNHPSGSRAQASCALGSATSFRSARADRASILRASGPRPSTRSSASRILHSFFCIASLAGSQARNATPPDKTRRQERGGVTLHLPEIPAPAKSQIGLWHRGPSSGVAYSPLSGQCVDTPAALANNRPCLR